MVVAVFSRLLQALGLGAEAEPDLAEKIDRVVVRLEVIEDRVAEVRYRLEQRSRELFEKVVQYLRRGQKSRAAIYAGEVSQIRSLLKMMYTVENLVIMTKERLKTVRDMRELGRTLMVFGAAINEIRDQVVALHPNLNMVFDEISRSVRSLVLETSVEAVGDIDPTVISSNALEVLEEAQKRAEEKIREEFPEPPVEPVIAAQPVAAAAGYAGSAAVMAAAEAAARRRKVSDEELEKLVLDYIRSHNGLLDIRDFIARYGVEKSDVLRALHRLAERGLIAIS